MVAGGLGVVARAAMGGGEGAPSASAWEPSARCSRCWRRPAGDVAEAPGPARRGAAWRAKLDGARIQVHKAGAGCGCTRDVSTRSPRRCRRSVEPVSAPPARPADPRRRGDRAAARRRAASLPGHHAPLRSQARGRGAARRASALSRSSSTSSGPTVRIARRSRARERVASSGALIPARESSGVEQLVTADAADGEALFQAEALEPRTRGPEPARLRARRTSPGRRGAGGLKINARQTLDLVMLGGGVGEWDAATAGCRTCTWGATRQPALAPGARSASRGRIRDAREDLQGTDRRDADWQTECLRAPA